jgi:hypothetical protein
MVQLGFGGARRVLNRTLELARKRGLLDTNPAKDAGSAAASTH